MGILPLSNKEFFPISVFTFGTGNKPSKELPFLSLKPKKRAKTSGSTVFSEIGFISLFGLLPQIARSLP
jgi:hypothetical protein